MRKPRQSLRQMLAASQAAQRFYAMAGDTEVLAPGIVLPPKRAYTKRVKPKGELSELQEQIRVIQWWDANCNVRFNLPGIALFAIPNGGSRGAIEAVNLKRSGVRPGIEDLFLSVPHGLWHGLFIEMKVAPNKQSTEQVVAGSFHHRQGYAAKVAYSHLEAIDIICAYLER